MEVKSVISRFCHSPLSPIISNFRSSSIVNDLGGGDRILVNLISSGITTQKKRRDYLLCIRSGIQKM